MVLRSALFSLLLIPGASQAYDLYENEHWSLAIKGSMQFDIGDVSDVGDATTGRGLWRRQRLAIDLGIGDNVDFVAEFDGKATAWTDLYLAINGLGPGKLYLGQFKQFNSLDQLTSSKRLLFNERSTSDSAFALSRRLGVGYLVAKQSYGLGASAFGRGISNSPSTSGVAVRGWLSPDNSAGDVSHYGMALTRESPDNDSIRFRARAATRFTTLRAASTPTLTDSTGLTRLGLEYGRVHGPWFVQTEAVWVQVERDSEDFTGSSAYIQASYTTGEPRGYKDGTFQSPGGDHPWEFGVRVDHIDLNDGAVRGGSALGIGVVAAYWLGKDTRIMLDANRYNRSNSELDPQSVNMRFQWTF